ncbi:BTB/POZ domain-containing protein KCTD7-like isoform X1 [Branchiostoma floridae]|uniref:BTB/POZ domain-containing protein KCTD7-like isoform X1 n=1 Tax=Branchiostoma floridae TaxID=7739 RepID=A0A9J7N0E4_BRAFL|nr:BTB/POZ domain-containing protein KCTD7-like isoform X1 [Branchiostoma floridae]
MQTSTRTASTLQQTEHVLTMPLQHYRNGAHNNADTPQFHFIVPLNVGGHHYTSTLPVLRKHEESMLAAMFSGRHIVVKDKDDRYFIERDGTNFGHILNFLRDSSRLPPLDKVKDVYQEALYYGIKPLADILRRYRPIREEEEVARWAEQCPAAQDKADEIADLVLKKFADTLSRTSRVVLQFDQEPCWESVHLEGSTGVSTGSYYKPHDFQQDESHKDHKCPLPEVSMGEMSEKERGKTLSFFDHYFEKLGYKVEILPGECREAVWSQKITWPGDGLDSITIYCTKQIYTLTFA